ncbi:FUSC family protein [Rhodococcus sp. X156]|uniref:FUSC family protein n=1 Tax=Rhodococcus sp. X156 TaxID=2499145 RepID=UPI0013E2ABEF|nr:FUSC family protein [Rhodococcus sp. X156]
MGLTDHARVATAAARSSLPSPITFFQAAVRSRGPQRQVFLDAGKAALAAALAWLLADQVLGSGLPWLAPYTAVFIIGTTVHQSMRSAARQVTVVILGVLLAAGVGLAIPSTVVALPVAVVLGLLIGHWRPLHPDGSWVALIALLLLTYGTATEQSDLLSRVGAVALGAVVGVAVNAVILPPIRLDAALSAMAARADDIAGLLVETAEGTEDGVDAERTTSWHHRVWQLEHTTSAEDALADGRDSLRKNPRRRSARTGGSAAPYQATATALDDLVPPLSPIVTAVAQQQEQLGEGQAVSALRHHLAELLGALAEAVHLLGQYPASPGDGANPGDGQHVLQRATDLHRQARRMADALPGPSDVAAVGALLAAVQRTLTTVATAHRATQDA